MHIFRPGSPFFEAPSRQNDIVPKHTPTDRNILAKKTVTDRDCDKPPVWLPPTYSLCS